MSARITIKYRRTRGGFEWATPRGQKVPPGTPRVATGFHPTLERMKRAVADCYPAAELEFVEGELPP